MGNTTMRPSVRVRYNGGRVRQAGGYEAAILRRVLGYIYPGIWVCIVSGASKGLPIVSRLCGRITRVICSQKNPFVLDRPGSIPVLCRNAPRRGIGLRGLN